MSVSPLLDSLGRRRSPAAVPGYLAGRRPGSKGRHYPVDPPRTEEIIAVMRCCGDGVHGDRARGLIVGLWRAGLRIQQALDLTELDLDARRGSVLVRRGEGGHRARSAWTTGALSNSSRGSRSAGRCPSVRCSASSSGRTRGR